MSTNTNNVPERVERNNSSSSLCALNASGHSKSNTGVFIVSNNGDTSGEGNGGLSANGTCSFNGVVISEVVDEATLKFNSKYKNSCTLLCIYDPQGVLLKITLGK